jgi:hypothetical protein
MHRFFVEHGSWTPARRLWPGTTLRGLDGSPIVVDRVEINEVESATYNLVIEETHCYFVGESPVLVHNGPSKESAFIEPGKFNQEIYGIWDNELNTCIYVGKSDDYQKRFKEYLREKEHWRAREPFLETKRIDKGHWTVYETAVWEKHYIEKMKLLNPKLENGGNPLSKKSFDKFKDLHMPCK